MGRKKPRHVLRQEILDFISAYEAARDEAQAQAEKAQTAMSEYEGQLAREQLARGGSGVSIDKGTTRAPIVVLDLAHDQRFLALEYEHKKAMAAVWDWERRLKLLRDSMRALGLEEEVEDEAQ